MSAQIYAFKSLKAPRLPTNPLTELVQLCARDAASGSISERKALKDALSVFGFRRLPHDGRELAQMLEFCALLTVCAPLPDEALQALPGGPFRAVEDRPFWVNAVAAYRNQDKDQLARWAQRWLQTPRQPTFIR